MPLADTILTRLRESLGPEHVLTAREDLIPYSFDGTAALQQMPGCVVLRARPRAGGAACSSWPTRRSTPVVTRGSGTGLSGGSLPVPDCIVLCLVKMDSILELDRANLTLLVEAGATTQAISDAADAAGLFYPPDPGSMKISTIGGNVAENSGGLRGLKYGVTRNYVMGLEVVLPDGEVLWTGNKCVKDVAGYSLRDLFIGSEGTLGVITKVLLKLIPKPAAKKTLVATFAQMDQAAQTVSDIIAAQIIPCTLEFLDRTTISLRGGLREDRPAAAIAKRCCSWKPTAIPSVVEEEAAQMVALARKNGAAKCAWPKTTPRRPSWPPPGAAPSPRWPASPPPRFSKTPPCRAANWPR